MEAPLRRVLVWVGVTLLVAALMIAVSLPLRSGLDTGQTDPPVAEGDRPRSTTPAPAAEFEISSPREVSRFVDRFEDGDLRGWTVTTVGSGSVTTGPGAGPGRHDGVRIAVPPDGRSAAGLRHLLARPTEAIRVFGRFRVLNGGCDESAPGSRGNVPLLRFFAPDGRRIVSLYRVNGSCGDLEELYVAHGRSETGTDEYLRFGNWHHLELRATPDATGRTVVAAYFDGRLVHEARVTTGPLRVASVGIHNEVPHQVGALEVDDVVISSLDPNPLATSAAGDACDQEPAERSAQGDPDGRVVVADGFHAGLGKWGVDLRGDARAFTRERSGRPGGCGLRLEVSSRRESHARLSVALPARARVVRLTGRYRITADGRTFNNVPIVRLSGAGRIFEFHRQNNSGEMWLRIVGAQGRTRYHRLDATMRIGTWHRFEMTLRNATGEGSFRVAMDGDVIGRKSGLPLPLPRFDTASLGSEYDRQRMTLDVDRVVLTARTGR